MSQLIVVGSGIAGLIAAYQAAQAGYSVEVLSKSPDPRRLTPAKFESSTYDGFINRYLTATEGHDYLEKKGYVTAMYPGIAEDFQRDLTKGGWLAQPMDAWDSEAQSWLSARSRANQNPAASEALFQEYLDENRMSMTLWYDFFCQQVQDPTLAGRFSLHQLGIDRFYDHPTLFAQALIAQQQCEVVKASYGCEALRSDADFGIYHAGLNHDNPFIQGGGLTIYGLAFDVKAFCLWLLDKLESLNVTLKLGAEFAITAIERDDAGKVIELLSAGGQRYSAHHYLMHPGAFCPNAVLTGTKADNQLAGVKGLWLRIKNAQELWGEPPRPNKIHGGKNQITMGGIQYPAQIADLNCMPQLLPDGRWDLIVGSGYVFIGSYPFTHSTQADRLALTAFANVVERVYDVEIDLDRVVAGDDDRIDLPSSGCVRSFTPDDRELRVIEPTASNGVLLIEGGGNTGTTTKAFFCAKVATEFLNTIDTSITRRDDLSDCYEQIRSQLRQNAALMKQSHWHQLESRLNNACGFADRPMPSNATSSTL